jgi:hypothetical protein
MIFRYGYEFLRARELFAIEMNDIYLAQVINKAREKIDFRISEPICGFFKYCTNSDSERCSSLDYMDACKRVDKFFEREDKR